MARINPLSPAGLGEYTNPLLTSQVIPQIKPDEEYDVIAQYLRSKGYDVMRDQIKSLSTYHDGYEDVVRVCWTAEQVSFVTDNGKRETIVRKSELIDFLIKQYVPGDHPIRNRSFRAPQDTEPPFSGDDMSETRTWESVRENAIKKASVHAIGKPAPRISYSDDGQFRCNCAESAKFKLCSHIAAMFLQGRDRRDFLSQFSFAKPRHLVLIPIGLGKAFCKAWLKPLSNVDGGYTGEFAASCELFPDEQIIVGENEGLLPYIKYVEGALQTTRLYIDLAATTSPASAANLISGVCSNSKNHTQSIVAANIAGMRPADRERSNFILGTVATIAQHKRCLPCHEAITGVNDIPDL